MTITDPAFDGVVVAGAHDNAGYRIVERLFTGADLQRIRDGVEAAMAYAVERTRDGNPVTTHTADGHLVQAIAGTSVHWEPDSPTPTVRNMITVSHLDPRIEVLWREPRLTSTAAELIGVDAVAPLTSRLTFKRAGVGSAYLWHQDYTFLGGLRGAQAAQAVTAMILLDDADAANGALQVVPGSHRDGPRPDDGTLRTDDAEPVTFAAPAGSVLFFPTLLMHASAPNRSERDRRTLLLTFQPAGRQRLDEYP